ncbi:hypothetical protein PHAVU_001G093200 [Phaseolus vulgaris]|uniref:uncharacterized protein isoform X2 n=1 Tax=Phaseolus vulgaris TaxID=3885 RepID=UPI0035CBDE0F
MASGTESTGMLTREQLFHLFDRFIFLTSQPDVKKRIAGAVQDKQEAVAVTTAIQEEIFLEMGIDPRFGISCLGKVSTVYENDLDLVIQFYKFLSKEEVACDEAELGEEEFAEKLLNQQILQEELHQQMKSSNYESETSILSAEQIEEIVPRKVSPLYTPR